MIHNALIVERRARSAHVALPRLLTIGLVLFISGCSSPPLEPWHTEELTEEFTAAKAEDVRTFEDYKHLEGRLFIQLLEKIYARIGTGPAYALVRYSAGSAADPRNNQPNWNRSFELTTEAPVGGVLLLHGMSDSPYSLRALGETLSQRGYWVIGLRLPGHGTAPSEDACAQMVRRCQWSKCFDQTYCGTTRSVETVTLSWILRISVKSE